MMKQLARLAAILLLAPSVYAEDDDKNSELAIDLPVQYAGSDEASKAFQQNVMPGLLKSIGETFDGKQIKDLAAAGLDPFRLTLAEDTSVRL